jgi:radical SAM superfamily enzyme YgiQ (UPF0313 family)
MNEILLVNSYILSKDLNEQRVMKPYAPLGIQYISSYLKSKGHDVKIFDGTFRNVPEFRSTLEELKPKVVGIYANVITKETALEMAAIAKQHNATVLVGGPGPVLDADMYFTSGVDVIVRSEGELTIEEILNLTDPSDKEQLNKVDGIIFKNNGRKVRTKDRKLIEDLDTVPFPDREAINIKKYMDAWNGKHGVSSVQILTARGCPYTCTWCSKEVFGSIYRKRSVEKVIEEMQLIKEKYNPDQLWIADDILTLKRDWILEFCSKVKEKDIAIPFECLARVDLVDEEVLAALKSIKCFRIWYGSESGSQKVLDSMKKQFTIEDVFRAGRLTKEAGIEVGFFIMIGYPGEEIEDIYKTVDMLKKLEPDLCGSAVAFPIKGTAFYKSVEDKIITQLEWKQRNENRLAFKGRYPKIFYWFAIRMINNVLPWQRLMKDKKKNITKIIATFFKLLVCKTGMLVTGHQFSK